MATPAYTGNFWAKSDRGDPQRIHLLEHHLADVGAWPAAAGATTWTRQLSPFDPSLEIDKLAMPANWLKGEEVPETLETAANEGVISGQGIENSAMTGTGCAGFRQGARSPCGVPCQRRMPSTP